ncbi:MAG: Transposase [Nitrospira sp.]|jgi:predicted transcriptional regulator|nr:Transposase [Nitrospira sp.]
MGLDETRASTILRAQVDQSGEVCMVNQERWAEIRRLFQEERISISEIGRRLDLDRKTVRRSVRQTPWQPDHRSQYTCRPCNVLQASGCCVSA